MADQHILMLDYCDAATSALVSFVRALDSRPQSRPLIRIAFEAWEAKNDKKTEDVALEWNHEAWRSSAVRLATRLWDVGLD